MDALKDAAEAMDKVITISQNGVAALSDKYALLAKTNTEVATLMRNQALLEYNEAINKIPKAISDASSSLLSFGDKALSAFSGGYASVDGFNDRLATLEITTDNYSEAMKQAYGAGRHSRRPQTALATPSEPLPTSSGYQSRKPSSSASNFPILPKTQHRKPCSDLLLNCRTLRAQPRKGRLRSRHLLGNWLSYHVKPSLLKVMLLL